MNFKPKGYQMISGKGEVAERVFQKIEGKGNKTYYVQAGTDERAGNVYVDCHDPRSEGFGGSVLTFRLEDGTEDKVKGPWHTNPDSLFKDTGMDIRNEHRTFVVLAMGRDPDGTLTDVVYQDPEGGIVGTFDRGKEIEKQFPEANYHYWCSRGGSSSGHTELGSERWKAERAAANA